MIYHWKAHDNEITGSEYQFDRTYSPEITPSQTLDLKHVEIIKFSDKCICDISLESSRHGDHRYEISP